MSAGLRPVRLLSRLELALVVMALASLAVILIPSERLRTSFEFVPTKYSTLLVDDRVLGGNSHIEWVDEKTQRWRCTLRSAFRTPFCSLQLDVTGADDEGINLSRYNTMTVWADYSGSATHLRIYLRNRHPDYYTPAYGMSTKYNEVEVPVAGLAKGLELNMSDFNVASWWLIAGNVPMDRSHPEFNEVSIVEVQTGSTDNSGIHEIQLRKIVWSGQLVSPSQLYQAVIIAWAVFIFGILVYRLLKMKVELNRQRRFQEELLAINASLNLESRRYEDMAKTDDLTGLSNRVGIRNLLHQGLMDWRSKGTSLSFIIIDLDNFKKINDDYGHDVGDEILKNAAELMARCVRRTDALARWGGEEFVLVCPETGLDQAVQAAENLRQEIEAHLKYRGEPITASFGVATMTEANLDHLFKKADMALYEAKRLNRNRVCSEVRQRKVS